MATPDMDFLCRACVRRGFNVRPVAVIKSDTVWVLWGRTLVDTATLSTQFAVICPRCKHRHETSALGLRRLALKQPRARELYL